MVAVDQLAVLHRHYIWADHMRVNFEERLKRAGSSALGTDEGVEVEMYMSLWYGLTYAVAEGWRDLKVQDRKIEDLLDSSNLALLKRYRNAVFHPQKEYWPEKFLAFLREGEESAKWVRELHLELGRFLLDSFPAPF
ncbi:hypothetical protein [Streptomyces sp. 900105755]